MNTFWTPKRISDVADLSTFIFRHFMHGVTIHHHIDSNGSEALIAGCNNNVTCPFALISVPVERHSERDNPNHYIHDQDI